MIKKSDRGLKLYKKQKSLEYIAKKCKVTLRTVRIWRRKFDWDSQIDYNPPPIAHAGAPKGSKNGKGGPIRNKNTVKHGLYAKYLPPETLAIDTDLEQASPIDILWANIKLKFAAIIAAQKILIVRSAEDNSKFTEQSTRVRVLADGSKEIEKTATEKQVLAIEKETKFLLAQSRAMNTLNNMIRTYDELCRSSLATEEQKARVDKLKAEINIIAGGAGEDTEGVQIIDDTN